MNAGEQGSEPRRAWVCPICSEAKSDRMVLSGSPDCTGYGSHKRTPMVEYREVGSGHDEQTEDLRAVLRRNGRPDTAPELQADFERRREQAIKDWAPYVGHHKDGEPIYHEATVAAVVEYARKRATAQESLLVDDLEDHFLGSSVSGGD